MATTWSQNIVTSLDSATLADSLSQQLAEVKEFTLAKASSVQNRIDLTIVARDSEGTAIPNAVFLIYLSDDATAGAGESDFSPSTAAATFAQGSLLISLEENGTTSTAMLVKADAQGDVELRYTDTAQEGFVLCAVPWGGVAPSLLEVVTGDYTD